MLCCNHSLFCSICDEYFCKECFEEHKSELGFGLDSQDGSGSGCQSDCNPSDSSYSTNTPNLSTEFGIESID